jgi:transposase, IS30 family
VAYLRVTRLRFWGWIRAGGSVVDAAACAGVSVGVGQLWFRERGGVMPSALRPAAGYRRLSLAEREQIHAGMERNESIRAIARRLGRHPSTIKREIDKNLRHQRYGSPGSRGRKRTRPWNYSPHLAQVRADRKAAGRARPQKLAGNDRLRAEVQTRLEEEHSPEQIAARLRVDFSNDPEMRVSHETIYRALYVQGRGALRRDLHQRLRTGRAVRKPRRQTGQRGSKIPNMTMIADRPPEADDRAVPGHWEGDLIVGKQSKSAIGTLVERATGFVMLLHLPDGHGADQVQAAMVQQMAQLPEVLRKTLTWDQGGEMANHAQIAEATDLDIYFCDPHSPWQRGSNENTNGLLRQYFPKGADLSVFAADYLNHVATKLNNRPRKRLNWKTPAEALDQLLSDPTKPPGVALAS